MKPTVCTLLMVLFFINTQPVSAQNFFWSDKGIGEGPIQDDFELSASPGQSGTMFLYYSPGGFDIREGIDFDFSWEIPGVVAFNAAETFDFDITILDTPFDLRWGDFAGPAVSVTNDAVSGFLTVNVVNGTGMLVDQLPSSGGPVIDTGVDIDSNSFLVGSFEWTATERGTTSLNFDSFFPVTPDNVFTYSELSISVIPEPKGSMAMMVWCLGFLIRNRSDK